MSELELRAPKAAAAICRVWNEKHVDHAIGGALALAYWCEPRATIDVNITVYLPLDQPGQTIELLVELGCDFSHLKVTTPRVWLLPSHVSSHGRRLLPPDPVSL